jgi:tetratricopeptide (TPR) repeat protein
VHAENSIEDTSISDQTDDGKSGQREEGTSILAEEATPAEAPAGTTSYLSTPVTATAHVFAPDTDVAEIMGHDQQGDSEEIRIIRGRIPGRTGALINAAYAAYVAGNYSDARQAYLRVLKDMPDNRDALLGMAAIAQRTGEPDEAGRYWMQVLADYPDDPVATAALINLMADQDYTGNTRTIEKLLQDDPHAAFLYFSLGNLHAAASRWPEAQRAFAEASRLEGDNPDYAYNLAVSLEHAGDRWAALDYYKTALELAHDQPVNFDSAVVMARITALSEISHGH